MMQETAGGGQERYRRLIEQSGVGLFQTKADGSIDWLNTAAGKLLGYESPEEFTASIRNIREIYVDPSRRDELLSLLERLGRVSNFEYEAKRKDGSRRWISVTARALLDRDGHLEGFEGTFFDVTEKKLLEAATRAISSNLDPAQAVAQFAAVLRKAVPYKQLSLVVIEGDHYRRVVSLSGEGSYQPLPTNESVPLRGNSVEEVVRTGHPVVVDDTSQMKWPFDRVLHEAGVASYGIFPLVDDGGVFATFNLGLPDKDTFNDEILSLVEVHMAAVTQAVKNILLYERQREVVARLEEVNRMKSEFLAGVAHDLRNPVAVLRNAATFLEETWDQRPDEQKLQMIRSISRSATKLSTLLQRDLDIALLDQGQLRYDIRPFDLGAAVTETVDAFASSESGRRFDLLVPDRVPVSLGDEQRQGQILHNLLSNAIKFSPPASTITIQVDPGDEATTVSVANEGAGIDPASQMLLFQRMSRLSSSQPGTGLGLYMSRAMVEAQGGRIWVESAPGEGAKFSYTVPLAKLGDPASRREAGSSSA